MHLDLLPDTHSKHQLTEDVWDRLIKVRISGQ